jgi:hypothetical protein
MMSGKVAPLMIIKDVGPGVEHQSEKGWDTEEGQMMSAITGQTITGQQTARYHPQDTLDMMTDDLEEGQHLIDQEHDHAQEVGREGEGHLGQGHDHPDLVHRGHGPGRDHELHHHGLKV